MFDEKSLERLPSFCWNRCPTSVRMAAHVRRNAQERVRGKLCSLSLTRSARHSCGRRANFSLSTSATYRSRDRSNAFSYRYRTTAWHRGIEEQIAGLDYSAYLSHNFFTQIAPCMDNPFFRGRFEDGIAEGNLAMDFEFESDLDPRAEHIRVRMLNASEPNAYWIFIKRL